MKPLNDAWKLLESQPIRPVLRTEDGLDLYLGISDVARFIGRVHVGEKCWMWSGPGASHGYGEFWACGRKFLTHRLSWSIFKGGIIPPGMMIRHACDIRLCVAPEHLSIGTAADNARDKIERGRQHQPKGDASKCSVLSGRDVAEIRNSTTPSKELATRFGVTHRYINMVRARTVRKDG